MRDGEASSCELVERCLTRLAQLGPQLNAFRVVLVERAMADAADVDRRLADGDDLPLAGVPIAVKDDTDVAGVSTVCGTEIDGGPARLDAGSSACPILSASSAASAHSGGRAAAASAR